VVPRWFRRPAMWRGGRRRKLIVPKAVPLGAPGGRGESRLRVRLQAHAAKIAKILRWVYSRRWVDVGTPLAGVHPLLPGRPFKLIT
jgi:hypothetical protein